MIAQDVARKYAKALFLSVCEKGLMDTAYEQLRDIGEITEAEPKVLTFLKSPGVREQDKVTFLREAFGSQIERSITEFLIVLVEKRRIQYLTEIIDEFNRLVEAKNGIGRATVITATPLADADREALVEKLAAKTNLKIELETKTDAAIMGGMIVIMHDQIIDGSVRRGLDLVKEELGRVRVV